MTGSLIVTVLVSSLLGSLHCAGMCGGFVACLSADARSPFRAHLAYHGGRLLTYSGLGALAGFGGSLVNRVGALAGLGKTASAVAATLMLLWGVALIVQYGRSSPFRVQLPAWLRERVTRWMARVYRRPPILRAGLLGLSSTLLPCGWLYAFVIVAAGTASATWGAAIMAAFWLGTVPALAALGVGLRTLLSPIRKHVPLVSGLALVAMGLATVFSRGPLPIDKLRALESKSQPGEAPAPDAASAACPHHAGAP